MRQLQSVSRRWFFPIVVMVALATVFPGAPVRVSANPGTSDPATADPEGGSASLRDRLAQAARGYTQAKAQVDASHKRQAGIEKELRRAELALARLTVEVSTMAAVRYKGEQVGILNGLLGSGSPERFLQGASVANFLVMRDDRNLGELQAARDQAQSQRDLLAAEVRRQEQHLTEMAKRKRDAERALAEVGGLASAGYTGTVPLAKPAPRNADGSWPSESCSVDDPTTSGCITPRTYHALQEARLAGFTHYVSCYRSGGTGEHPKGRACDFAAAANGFGGTATGADKTYGTRLAAWCIANADRLGVLYVIWFRQIWMPGIGWRSYTGNGTPSGDHTNHVHLSMI